MVKVDKTKCIGCGACTQHCPEVFAIDGKTHKAKVKKNEDNSCVDEAIEMCPVRAISK